MTRPRRAASLACALAATAAALAWETLTIACNHRGDWAAMFHTAAWARVPAAIEVERVRRFPGGGYDGQFYHIIAHDPLLDRDFAGYVDNPRMRWRRILVPGLANLLALGDDDLVDSCYAAVLFGAIFSGAWWLSRWSVGAGRSPWIGLGFLLVPATPISLDRGTVDVALAALAVGFATARGWVLWLALAAAPLARETGALLLGAHAAASRRWWGAAVTRRTRETGAEPAGVDATAPRRLWGALAASLAGETGAPPTDGPAAASGRWWGAAVARLARKGSSRSDRSSPTLGKPLPDGRGSVSDAFPSRDRQGAVWHGCFLTRSKTGAPPTTGAEPAGAHATAPRRWWDALAASLAGETGAPPTDGPAAASWRWWDGAAALPFAAWWAYVSSRTAPDLTSHLSSIPFAGIVHRATHPVAYPLSSDWIRRAAVLDYLAFLGVCACFVLVVAGRRWWREREWLAAAAFCAALAFVGHPQVWAEAYAFGRVASPLLVMLGLLALRRRWWWGLLPLAMVLPRILFQLGPQWRGILR